MWIVRIGRNGERKVLILFKIYNIRDTQLKIQFTPIPIEWIIDDRKTLRTNEKHSIDLSSEYDIDNRNMVLKFETVKPVKDITWIAYKWTKQKSVYI